MNLRIPTPLDVAKHVLPTTLETELRILIAWQMGVIEKAEACTATGMDPGYIEAAACLHAAHGAALAAKFHTGAAVTAKESA